MRRFVLVVSLAAVPVLCVADQVSQTRPQTMRQIVRRPSQEQLDRLRRSLVAQIAVHDAGEQAMRAPTVEQAAALANTEPDTFETLSVAGGGVALRSSGAQMSMLVATQGDDGTIRVAHEGAPVTTAGAVAKGGADVR